MAHENIGDEYQRLTKYARGSLPGHSLDWSKKPSLHKEFEKVEKTIALPPAADAGGPPLWEVIRLRRSLRSYRSEPIPMGQLSRLLWATQGITLQVRDYQFRAAPSAGALYPVETYVVVNRVEELEPGLYHYDAVETALQLLRKGSLGRQAAAAALDQRMAETAAVVFIWTAVVERSKWKYRQRAYRYVYLDAGHIGQNLYLAATALGLGCCTIGAIYDDEANKLVGVDGVEETTVYMGCVGTI